jgi:hypothetical protein
MVTLMFAATAAWADAGPTPEGDEPADSAELAVLADQYAALERDLTANLGSRLDAFCDRVTRTDLTALSTAHDVGMARHVAVRRAVQGAGRTSASAMDREILAADGSWKIVITQIHRDGPPAAPLP